MLRLNPVQQAPIGNHLSELVHVLGSPSHCIRILTIKNNGQVSIMEERSHFLQHIEHFTVCLGPCFCAEDTSPLIDLIRCMTRLQTSTCSSLCIVAQAIPHFGHSSKFYKCLPARFRRLCLVNAVTLVDDLVVFAQRQPLVQEIVLADPLIVQHNGKATLAMEPIQSFWSHHAHSTGPHGRYVKVSVTYL